ncbi:MAG: SDR family oxidoreductase [Lautropia sp.]
MDHHRTDGHPIAWITGGATGIGFATAQALGAAGYTVLLSGRRRDELERAAAALGAAGVSAETWPLDVADPDAVDAAATAIAERHGRIDALVLASGINVPDRHWQSLSADGFAKVVAVNLNGVAYCVAAALPAMRRAGSGTIVVISSWAGWRLLPVSGVAYGASKQGLAPLVELINHQEGHRGIRATLLCPGEVATPMMRQRPVPPPAADLEKMLRPEDVASAIHYVVTAPPRVCINELVIAPSWNRIYLGADDLKLPR